MCYYWRKLEYAEKTCKVNYEVIVSKYPEDDSEIEFKHCTSILMDSVKLSREYLVHLNWIKLASNPCGLDSSTGRAADRYSEGASSNPAQVNIFRVNFSSVH